MILSKRDSLVIKGIAICAMLCWHLFFCPNPIGKEYCNLVKGGGMLGDVCVSLFLFVSGYGLAIQYDKLGHHEYNLKFILKRLAKFYCSYWFIFLIFVPLCILAFKIPFTSSTSIVGIIKEWIEGIAGFSEYNPNWWFNALIISFYLFFPLLFICIKSACIPTLLASFFAQNIKFSHIPDIGIFSLAFSTGIAMAIYRKEIHNILIKIPKKAIILTSILFICFATIWLNHIFSKYGLYSVYYRGIKAYYLLTISILMIVFLFKDKKCFYTPFSFLGKHSMNIYFIHYFIYYLWLPDFIFSFKCPITSFLVLMAICLIISMLIEAIKSLCRYGKLVDKSIKLIDRIKCPAALNI